MLTLWSFLPPIITALMSFGRISFYVDRYLLIVTPALTILMVSGLLSLRSHLLHWGLTLILIAATGLGLERIYFDPINFSKEDWRTVADQVDAQAKPGDQVITCTDGHKMAFQYYNPQRVLKSDDIFFASQVSSTTALDETVWLINVHPRLAEHHLSKTTSPGLDRTLLAPEVASREGNSLKSIIRVSGISVYHYDAENLLYLPQIVAWHCGL